MFGNKKCNNIRKFPRKIDPYIKYLGINIVMTNQGEKEYCFYRIQPKNLLQIILDFEEQKLRFCAETVFGKVIP